VGLVTDKIGPSFFFLPIESQSEGCTANILLMEAKEAIKSRNSNCEIMVAEDFMEISVPRSK